MEPLYYMNGPALELLLRQDKDAAPLSLLFTRTRIFYGRQSRTLLNLLLAENQF